jgi:hypothetical protein
MKNPLKRKIPESAMHKLTESIRNSLRLIWFTLVVYIIYVEFVRDIITIL